MVRNGWPAEPRLEAGCAAAGDFHMNGITRRDLGRGALGAWLTNAATSGSAVSSSRSSSEWRKYFPILEEANSIVGEVYLDSAATTHRAATVIDAITGFYARDNANPAGALHRRARRAHERFEAARETVARFVNARTTDEIVWTRGTTEAVNLVATSWAERELKAGDEILLTVSEHASNLLPWRIAAKRARATVRYADVDESGRISLADLERKVTKHTRLVAFSHISNVAGYINPADEICSIARKHGALVFVDAAQSAPHVPIDVQSMNCDFLGFSSHKMVGPMAIGVLWVRRHLLERMSPYQSGSNMAHDVDIDTESMEHAARKFGAGTPNASGAIGLAAAIDFLNELGRDRIEAHEAELVKHGLNLLRMVPGLRLLGPADPERRVPVFSFVIEGLDARDVMRALDERQIAVRAGDLAALPLLQRLGTRTAVRASAYLYTRRSELDRLADALLEITGAQHRRSEH
jgi:cysteine desulfurase/selenocysteine lyase